MEPRIQYAKTKDGVSIAFRTLGEGMPFVEMPSPPWSHVQVELQVPLWRAWDERLAERRMHVRYDHRGSGLSERNITNLSLDALLLDLEAVVDRLGLERFDLFGHHLTAAVAIVYAVRNPERVSHLVLWCGYTKPLDLAASPQARAIRTLIEQDWETYTETVAHLVFGWSQGEEAHRFATVMREFATHEVARAYQKRFAEVDVTGFLPEVKAPTLVLHRRRARNVPIAAGRTVAALIPDARFVALEGDIGGSFFGDISYMEIAMRFLDEGRSKVPAAEPDVVGAFRTILFTDVEESTALTQRLGDARAREVLRTHERIVREALRAHGGAEVKTMGDGFMASFSSATRALECAIAVQRAFAEHNESAQEPVRVRIGLNAGEPIAEEEDLFGTAVIVAARIATKAEGGEILASDVVRQLVAGKDFLFADRGETALRGFEDPVRLYEVRWREE